MYPSMHILVCQERKRISMVAIDVGLAKDEKGIDAVGLVHNKRPLLRL